MVKSHQSIIRELLNLPSFDEKLKEELWNILVSPEPLEEENDDENMD